MLVTSLPYLIILIFFGHASPFYTTITMLFTVYMSDNIILLICTYSCALNKARVVIFYFSYAPIVASNKANISIHLYLSLLTLNRREKELVGIGLGVN